MRFFDDILFFFFPYCCEVCGRLLIQEERIICSSCYLDIPRTNFHLIKDNPVSKLFWGRTRVNEATSWFYFNKGSSYQVLLHKLKYKGYCHIGIFLGKAFASELSGTSFACADMIIPVPLHPCKEKKRGYNQSEKIARGMASVFKIPVDISSLVRPVFTETQTRRNRFERFLNMQDKFEVRNEEKIINKKVLLVDDVVTTGATLEACTEKLLDAGSGDIMIATIAVA